jgi:hypothetical protein
MGTFVFIHTPELIDITALLNVWRKVRQSEVVPVLNQTLCHESMRE